MEKFGYIVIVIETCLLIVLGATSFRYHQIGNKNYSQVYFRSFCCVFMIWFGLGVAGKWSTGHLYTFFGSIGDNLSPTPRKHNVEIPSALYIALPYMLIFMTLIVFLIHFVMLSNMKTLEKEFLRRTLHTTRKAL